jgi:hypothetical protein
VDNILRNDLHAREIGASSVVLSCRPSPEAISVFEPPSRTESFMDKTVLSTYNKK